MKFHVGQRVRTTKIVERWPHFWVEPDSYGTVVEIFEDDWDGGRRVDVMMDEYIPGCDEWDNTIVWVDAPEDDLEEVAR